MVLQRAWIHVGTGKTGSSSLQRLLATSTQRLEEQGVAFLGRMLEQHVARQKLPRQPWQYNSGWPEWLAAIQSGESYDSYLACLEQQLDSLEDVGTHTVILSNEGYLAHVDIMKPVVSSLAKRKLEVKTLAAVRRHYEYAFSAYLQWGVRHKTNLGRVLPFRQWLSQRPPQFAQSLKSWRDCSGVSALELINYSAVPDVVPAILKRMELLLPLPNDGETRANSAASLLEALLLSTYHDHRDNSVHPSETAGLLERLSERDHVLRREANHNWCECSEQDIEPLVRMCQKDMDEINIMLQANGQPEFANAVEQPPTLPSSLKQLDFPRMRQQEEILAALLSIVVDLDHQARRQEKDLRQLRRALKMVKQDQKKERDMRTKQPRDHSG